LFQGGLVGIQVAGFWRCPCTVEITVAGWWEYKCLRGGGGGRGRCQEDDGRGDNGRNRRDKMIIRKVIYKEFIHQYIGVVWLPIEVALARRWLDPLSEPMSCKLYESQRARRHHKYTSIQICISKDIRSLLPTKSSNRSILSGRVGVLLPN